LNDLQQRHKNIILQSNKKNNGLAYTRNAGWDIVRTDYVFFIDDDDLLERTTLEKFYFTLASEPEISFVSSFLRAFGDKSYDWKRGDQYGYINLLENSMISCAMFKNIKERYSVIDTCTGCEDWDHWLRLANKGYTGYTIPDILFLYRKCAAIDKDSKRVWKFSDMSVYVDRYKKAYPNLYANPLEYPYPYRDFYKLEKGDFYNGYGKIKNLKYTDLKYCGEIDLKTHMDKTFKQKLELWKPPSFKYVLQPDLFDDDHYKKTIDNNVSYRSYIKDGQFIPWHCVPYKQPETKPYKYLFDKNSAVHTNTDLLLIIPWMNMGGADRFNLNLSQHMKNINKKMTIIATECNLFEKNINTWYNLFKETTDDIHVLYEFLSIHEYMNYIKHIIHDRRPKNIIISNSLFASTKSQEIRDFITKYKIDCKFSHYVHMEEETWYNGGYARFACDSIPYVDNIFVTSIYLQNWIKKRITPEHHHKVELWMIGTDTNKFTSSIITQSTITQSTNNIIDPVKIITLCRFVDQKKPMQLMNIIKKSQGEFANSIRYTIVGNGPYADKMKQFITDNNLNNVNLIVIHTDDVAKYLQDSHILLQTTEWEGIPSVFFEAISCGVPVISVDVGGSNTLIKNNQNGHLINKGDDDDEIRQYMDVLTNIMSHRIILCKWRNKCLEQRKNIDYHNIFDNIMKKHFKLN